MRKFSYLAATAAAAALVGFAAAAESSSTSQDAADFTTLVVQPIVSPRPVNATDGRTHLVYELLLVNGTPLHTRIDAIAAFDPTTGATLGEWKGEALAAIFRLNGRMPGATLRPGGSAYAFLDASVPEGAPVPHAVKHRISVSRFMESPNDKEKLAPLDPSMGVPNVTSFEGAETAVDPAKAVVIAPPLRGKGWIAFNGCCADLQHRGSVMAFNGAPKIPERFAIDFVKLDGERRVFSGPPDRNESYADYGLPVYAVADGTVIETSDGAPERIPTKPREPTRFDTVGGNYVVIDIGGGHFAFFAHLKTGSVAVKRGDRVKAGDVIGALGDTGNSDGPHLHFHVMDGPSPLSSNGIPYVFESFTGAGRLAGDSDRLNETGGPADIDSGWRPGPHRAELPLDLEVIDFPDK